MHFTRSLDLQERLRKLVPGGGHTYAKGSDQFPESIPGVIARGEGCHVWDVDGNEFIEYGMGLRAVTLGHAYAPVVEAVRESLAWGTNFTRPAAIELECAESFLALIHGAEMVKFTKDGSTALSAALKLARAHTGRKRAAICADHPFFSYDDWFIATTTMDGGIPSEAYEETLRFPYNDLPALEALFAQHGTTIAAVFLEPSRLSDPLPGFLERLRALCTQHGVVLVFDEMITGFRWHLHGAQNLYGVTPDLSTFGKALANGFALSALAGKRELMRLGSRTRAEENVFLLSTTHGAETPGLAAGIRTMQIYRDEPVVEHLHRQGDRLRTELTQAAQRHGVQEQFELFGRSCNLLFGTKDAQGKPSQELRTLFLQETLRRGVLMPSLVVSYSHRDEDIDRTVDVVDQALAVYARALSDGVQGLLEGRPSRTVFDRK
ncbi:MAG TPA: glutamate-1-semialdehyde 2,1-aminomutase [Polyangiales bacterium]|nr:glutamate-1-semialdehyde 2,1-aminomutase [Polyangiales bacterium]